MNNIESNHSQQTDPNRNMWRKRLLGSALGSAASTGLHAFELSDESVPVVLSRRNDPSAHGNFTRNIYKENDALLQQDTSHVAAIRPTKVRDESARFNPHMGVVVPRPEAVRDLDAGNPALESTFLEGMTVIGQVDNVQPVRK